MGVSLWAIMAQVKAFLVTSGIEVAGIDAMGGLIDTTWVQLEARWDRGFDSELNRAYNATRLVHILQQTQSASGSSADWPERSDDEALKQTMLRNIAQYIANGAEFSPVS